MNLQNEFEINEALQGAKGFYNNSDAFLYPRTL